MTVYPVTGLQVDVPASESVSLPNVFNVLDYGADPTGAASSHNAFQLAIDDAKLVGKGPNYGAWANARSGIVYVPKGTYTGIWSLDCTGAVGLVIEGQAGWGSALYANGQTTSAPILDFTESNYCQIRNLAIHAQKLDGAAPDVIPTAGVFFADSNEWNGASNKNACHEVNIFGYFTGGSVSIYRSTNNNFFGCALHNDNLNGAASLLVTRQNTDLPVESLYKTLAPTGFVANENAFFGCEFHGPKTASANGAPIWLGGANTTRFFGAIIDSNGTNQPFVHHTASGEHSFFSACKFYSEAGVTGQGGIFQAAAGATIDRIVCIGTFKDSPLSGKPNTMGGGTFTNMQANGL